MPFSAEICHRPTIEHGKVASSRRASVAPISGSGETELGDLYTESEHGRTAATGKMAIWDARVGKSPRSVIDLQGDG